MIRKPSHIALALAALAVAGTATFVAWPLPDGLLDRRPVAAVRFTDRTGLLLREVRSRADGRSVPLPPDEPVPFLVRDAVLAAEDLRFDRHPGVDVLAAARASWQALSNRRIVSGASTIPMQLARQVVQELAPHRRRLGAKVREMLWALRISAHVPRERILRAYLDRVYLGNGVYGFEAAAQTYFGRPARTLSLGQAALLAGVIRSPSGYEPWRHLHAARGRLSSVVGRMRERGIVSAEDAARALAAPLDLAAAPRTFEAPHLVDALSAALPALGLDGAASIETTIDPALQRDVEEILRGELRSDARLANGAAIVIDNATGEVLAYVGSDDWLDEAREGQNDGVRALRQPGSALKPFAYGLGLSRGYTAASILSDAEAHLSTPGGDWVPRNYDRRMHGPVRLRAALQNSYNVPAVRLAEALGTEAVLRVLRAAGFASLDASAEVYGAGLVLGNGDVSLRELARAYRGLARGGVVEPLVEVRAAADAAGRPLALARELAPRRFLPARAVALLTDILSDEAARAPAFGLQNALRLPFPVAAKTGTSRAYVDNWTAGYTAERTVAVWVGSFDGTPMHGVSGITGAGPIFGRIMLRAMRAVRPAPLLERSRLAHATICPLSGKRAGPHCPASLDEVFLPGTEPRDTCDMHREGAPGRPALDLPPEHLAWARGEGIEARAAGTGGAVRILRPGDGDEYLIEAGYPDGAQGVPVRLALPGGTARAEVRVDGQRVVLEPPFAARLPARQGVHRLEVWLPGASAPAASARFTVRGGS